MLATVHGTYDSKGHVRLHLDLSTELWRSGSARVDDDSEAVAVVGIRASSPRCIPNLDAGEALFPRSSDQLFDVGTRWLGYGGREIDTENHALVIAPALNDDGWESSCCLTCPVPLGPISGRRFQSVPEFSRRQDGHGRVSEFEEVSIAADEVVGLRSYGQRHQVVV